MLLALLVVGFINLTGACYLQQVHGKAQYGLRTFRRESCSFEECCTDEGCNGVFLESGNLVCYIGPLTLDPLQKGETGWIKMKDATECPAPMTVNETMALTALFQDIADCMELPILQACEAEPQTYDPKWPLYAQQFSTSTCKNLGFESIKLERIYSANWCRLFPVCKAPYKVKLETVNGDSILSVNPRLNCKGNQWITTSEPVNVLDIVDVTCVP